MGTYHFLLFRLANVQTELQVRGDFHGFGHRQIRVKLVILHDVARQFPEGTKVPLVAVHRDATLRARWPKHKSGLWVFSGSSCFQRSVALYAATNKKNRVAQVNETFFARVIVQSVASASPWRQETTWNNTGGRKERQSWSNYTFERGIHLRLIHQT